MMERGHAAGNLSPSSGGGGASVLDVSGLSVEFPTARGVVKAVDNLSFEIERGETLGLAGESGAGKSQTALAIMGLLDAPGRVTSGTIKFDGQELTDLAPAAMRDLRGGAIAMVFQDPLSALNPVFTVGSQIVETIRRHQGAAKARAWRLCEELLAEVEIPEPQRRARQYPHELSGGMRQRAMIAMAIANRPKLLIADEPTTALDVTVQAEILDLLARLQRDYGMAMILISHDLAVLAQAADKVSVIYAGRLVEGGPVEGIFYEPQHPYTIGLLASIPRADARVERWQSIPGQAPSPFARPPGCPFEPRCRFARDECSASAPALTGPVGHLAACVLTEAERARARRDQLASQPGVGDQGAGRDQRRVVSGGDGR